MHGIGRILIALAYVGGIAFIPVAPAAMPGIWNMPHTLQPDNRIVKDRLHPQNNRFHEDESFLNAVGAVWSQDIKRSAVGYAASSGFLIDRCHVLTSMHVVYPDRIVVKPALGKAVVFGVGQTEGDANRGALQGLRYVRAGAVTAYGETTIVEHRVQNPDGDWALIRLADNIDDSIEPMPLTAVDSAGLPRHFRLSAAGFPADHRDRRSQGLNLKDLWGSDGEVVAVVATSTIGAIIETTIQATRGNSGGPVYGDFDGRPHVVIGIVESIHGNGIDVSADNPSIQVLFTPYTLERITAAQAETPCT